MWSFRILNAMVCKVTTRFWRVK